MPHSPQGQEYWEKLEREHRELVEALEALLDAVEGSRVTVDDCKRARVLLQRLNREMGKTVLMVTHDPHAAERAQKTLHLDKGVLTS